MQTLVRQHPRVAGVSLDKRMGPWRHAVELAVAWCSRTRQFDALARLDDRLLADIGLTREQQMLTRSKLFLWHP